MPALPIRSIDDVGPNTIAVELDAPTSFEAYPGQFVLVQADIDGDTETGYYTISSPFVDDTFEITVAVDPDGTVGPWLNERSPGDEISVEGPHGNVTFAGEEDAFVLASGPGIGPAIGIGERAIANERETTIAYYGEDPPHERRLRSLGESGATVIVAEDETALAEGLEERDDGRIFVFGFKEFVDRSKRLLSDEDIDPDGADIESFGPA